MPIALFEALSVGVVVATLALMARARPPRALAAEYVALAAAAWLGEASCVAGYGFYGYAPSWHLRLAGVPMLVPLIWPLVVLSAQEVVRALAPEVTGVKRAALVGAVVAFDASLVEVVAVRAGLWSWSEPGHLGVPLVGILGWGYFAFGATLAPRPAWIVVTGPALAHLAILGSWWAFFRWTLRGELASAGFAVLGVVALAALAWAVAAKRRGRGLVPAVWLPRVLAALLFVALLVTTDPTSAPLWAHTALVAVPYLAATLLRAPRAPRNT